MAQQIWTISFGIIILILIMGQSEALLRRCFSCRSRGDLGDCRDPFLLSNGVQGNATTVGAIEGKKDGIDQPPCSSGWCSKILENVDKAFREDADYGTATQRDCLQRPPSDGQERCAYVTWNHKRVYMCFCKGDLCNSAPKSLGGLSTLIMPIAIFTYLASYVWTF